MQNVIYSNGDSVTWGAELNNKKDERFSAILANKIKYTDCNNASAGVSNDYIYRQSLRDVLHWINHRTVWSEETGWVNADNIFMLIGWTAPTRFELWNGNHYVQERLWADYDKWGINDVNKQTEINFILNQTDIIPSYVRTFNHIISLSSILTLNRIPHYFFNVFYEYEIPTEPSQRIDKFGKLDHQTDLKTLWYHLPSSFKDKSMYSVIRENHGTFLDRNHPSAYSHTIWSNYLLTKINI
jgi:hypothetical protein